MKIHFHITLNDKRKRRRARLLWGIGPISEQPLHRTNRRRTKMLKLTTTQQAALSISAVDRKGKAAQVESIRFTSSDESVATVTQDTAEPSKALLKAVNPGTAQVNVSADPKLGDEVGEIHGTLDVTVVASEAVGFTINTGTPEDQPE